MMYITIYILRIYILCIIYILRKAEEQDQGLRGREPRVHIARAHTHTHTLHIARAHTHTHTLHICVRAHTRTHTLHVARAHTHARARARAHYRLTSTSFSCS